MRRPSLRIPRASLARRVRPSQVVLWTAQVIVAALFLFAGGMKLVTPAATLAAQSPLPIGFLRGIGALEVLGALGLVLPGILRLRAELTVLAAAGLVCIMCGAVGATLVDPHTAGTPAMAIMPVVVGAVAAAIAYARTRELGYRRVRAGGRPLAASPAASRVA